MYCSTCGNKIAENLNYCNSCGSRIDKNPLVISNSSSSQLARSLGIVSIAGLLGFIAVLKLLLDNGGGLDIAAKVIILLGYLAAVVLISAMMIGHMWKNSGDIRIRHRELSPDEPARAGFVSRDKHCTTRTGRRARDKRDRTYYPNPR